LIVSAPQHETVSEFGRYLSPLRYPGGKAALAPFLADIISKNNLNGCEYFEPFAGGAGAALRLLVNQSVSAIHLNDADFRVYTFWKVIFDQPHRFAEAVLNAILDVSEWKKQHAICKNCRSSSRFEIAYATFYLNRCNRSGVIMGAGPIGGHNQSGNYHLDARFDRERLAERILAVAALRHSVKLYNHDAIDFLRTRLPRGGKRASVFVYLDPPYFNEGRRLYLSYYSHRDHKRLADYVLKQRKLRWIASYDDEPEILKLYRRRVRRRVPVNYSLNQRRKCDELLIASENLKIPGRNSWKTTRAAGPRP
jgi:DNA adenine methylase